MKISVILCTHNPRSDYLNRTLGGLREQTFPANEWELLLIDNASEKAVADQFKLDWHPAARLLLEKNLGLTHARLRGMGEAQADLLVFVDDDNILRPDYLQVAYGLAEAWPKLGAWSGRVLPEFEVEPPVEVVPYLNMLCIRDAKKEAWGNSASVGDHTPWGAGMCLRRAVAEHYARAAASDGHKTGLGRRGASLASTEDIDIALTSLDVGLGMGVFPALELLHLMPANRLTREYFLKLIEDTAAGQVVFEKIRGMKFAAPASRIDHVVKWYKKWRAAPFERAVDNAIQRGRAKGNRALAPAGTLTPKRPS